MIAIDEPMPKCCKECMFLLDFTECRPLRKEIEDYTKKPNDCPLREIPDEETFDKG